MKLPMKRPKWKWLNYKRPYLRVEIEITVVRLWGIRFPLLPKIFFSMIDKPSE